jgi:hypothetical protein
LLDDLSLERVEFNKLIEGIEEMKKGRACLIAGLGLKQIVNTEWGVSARTNNESGSTMGSFQTIGGSLFCDMILDVLGVGGE